MSTEFNVTTKSQISGLIGMIKIQAGILASIEEVLADVEDLNVERVMGEDETAYDRFGSNVDDAYEGGYDVGYDTGAVDIRNSIHKVMMNASTLEAVLAHTQAIFGDAGVTELMENLKKG